MEKHPLHLKIPDLQTSPEVESAVSKRERLIEEEIPNDPSERIEAYLDRLEKLILDPEKKQDRKKLKDVQNTDRPRALAWLRERVMDEYVRPNKQKMAEGAAMVEERAARQMGVDVEYGEEQLERRGEIAVGDLESSLDQWITYLSDPNEPYPMWFRYYAFRNILNLAEYDKTKQEFPKRSKGTFKLFPDVDRGALAYVQEMMEASQDPTVLNRIRDAQKTPWDTPESELLTVEKAKAFNNLSFAKQYAEAMKQNGEITPELRAETRGEWVKYEKGSDPKALWASLQNKGTAWCTKGFPTANTQLEGGDFYVYYTLDKNGEPTVPRIAIRMQDDKIAENPRGVFDAQQNLEPNMMPILEEKLKDFGGESEKFKKKSADMRQLTEIEKKTKEHRPLSKQELEFLYELNGPIVGFGYQKDPRIVQIREERVDRQELFYDMQIIFECNPDQIAHTPQEITKDTKAYLGPWNPTVLQTIKNYPNIFHLYESFPDKKIFLQTIETDQSIQTPQQAEAKLKEKAIHLSDYGKDLLYKTEFSKAKESYQLVRFTVGELGFSGAASTDEICAKAKTLGFDLCPAEVGPQLRLSYSGGELMFIAMKQILDRDDSPRVFDLYFGGGELRLGGNSAGPDDRWAAGNCFVFCLRK